MADKKKLIDAAKAAGAKEATRQDYAREPETTVIIRLKPPKK